MDRTPSALMPLCRDCYQLILDQLTHGRFLG
jgi:hypothetical protein